MKILKVTLKNQVLYATSYKKKGKGWEAFTYGVGWRAYWNAIEIEVDNPVDLIDLAVAAYRFGWYVAARLMDHLCSHHEANSLAWAAGNFWDLTYSAGYMFPISDFTQFIRHDRRLAVVGYYTLDVVLTDKLLKAAYPKEYGDGLSMSDFIAFKFGQEVRDAYLALLERC